MAILARSATRSILKRTQTFVGNNKRALSSKPCTVYLAPTHPEETETLPFSLKAKLDDHSHYLTNAYARPPIMLKRGEGMSVWDVQGRQYLDFTAGIAVNALGHSDPGVQQVLNDQAGILLHTSNVWWNEWAGELAKLLVQLTKEHGGLGYTSHHVGPNRYRDQPGGAKVFFTNSGTEANEGALKFARKYGKASTHQSKAGATGEASTKTQVLSFSNAFHGRSMGALSATHNPKYQLPFAPLIPGFLAGKYGDIEDMERLVGPDTCAVIVEPIQGEGGVNGASKEFLRALRAACNKVDAVLIYDEIQCGLYRTGSLWAHSTLPIDCHPDIITMAKPLANGYPIGAVMVKDKVADVVTPGSHGTTFGGSPMATRLGHHVLTRLSQPQFIASLHKSADYLNTRLEHLPKQFPDLVSSQVRGKGLIRGIPFKDTADPARMVKLARERGLLILTAGSDAVRLVPSLIVDEESVKKAMDIIESCLVVLKGEKAS